MSRPRRMEDGVSDVASIRRVPRVLFFGMQCNFSFLALQALLENGIEVCAVVIPATPLPGVKPPAIQRREPARVDHLRLSMLNASMERSLVQLAGSRQVPVWEVKRLAHSTTVATLAAYHADLICVACFSQRVPQAILDLPRLGCLNVHPSLLPGNRGPVPLFWTFREGHATTGVTVHCMNERLDSGDIVLQETIAVPDGIRYDELEMRCAERGGILLAQAVRDIYVGRARPIPQDETKSSYHPFPGDEDFVVHADAWSARHVYNFVRSVHDWQRPVEMYHHTEHFFVRDAISYSTNDNDEALSLVSLVPASDGTLLVPCRVGMVRVLLDSPYRSAS